MPRGSTPCPSCGTCYQNNAVPYVCPHCEYEIGSTIYNYHSFDKIRLIFFQGGAYVKKSKPVDSRLITQNIASVRKNPQVCIHYYTGLKISRYIFYIRIS